MLSSCLIGKAEFLQKRSDVGLALTIGVVRALHADPSTRLDVVPVDLVSQRIIETAFGKQWPKPGDTVPIRYAAMGTQHALRIDMTTEANQRFFRERPGVKAVPQTKLWRGDTFERADLVSRELPMQLTRALLTVTGRKRDKRRLERADEKVQYLNQAFRYFTHHTFDFKPVEPFEGWGIHLVQLPLQSLAPWRGGAIGSAHGHGEGP